MMILEVALTVFLVGAEASIMPPAQDCPPDEVCYPIDPNPPKSTDCPVDEVCYPIDDDGKWR